MWFMFIFCSGIGAQTRWPNIGFQQLLGNLEILNYTLFNLCLSWILENEMSLFFYLTILMIFICSFCIKNCLSMQHWKLTWFISFQDRKKISPYYLNKGLKGTVVNPPKILKISMESGAWRKCQGMLWEK